MLLSYAQRDFYSALTEKQAAQFNAAAVKFVGLILLISPFFALYAFVQVEAGAGAGGKKKHLFSVRCRTNQVDE